MGISPFGGFDIMFSVVPIIVIIGFGVVIGLIVARSVQGAKRWKRNNNSPVLTVDSTVVTKRSDVRHHHHHPTNDMPHMSSSTIYYATFEVASGDRLEFEIHDTEYGQLVENDNGKLTFQGTRYLGFERNR
jgi:hypothetical protein